MLLSPIVLSKNRGKQIEINRKLTFSLYNKAIKWRSGLIKKVIKKGVLDDNFNQPDLAYWLTKSHNERLEAVEILRKQFHGITARLQRTVRVIQLTQS